MRRRDALVAAAVAAGAAILAALPVFEPLAGLSTDTLFWLRHKAYGAIHAPESSPAVVIAIDEETHRRPPFADLPSAFWTRDMAPVLDAVVDGGARVVGFDIIFSKSAEAFERGFDRPFLLSLRKAADAGKVVLGKVQHGEAPIAPHAAQSAAVRHHLNTRANNLVGDADEMIRRAPLFFDSADGKGGVRKDSSMSLELAARALGKTPETRPDGKVTLGGWTIPGSETNAIQVNFGAGRDIPTFSLADLHACAGKGDDEAKAFFRRHFKDKVVLVGAVVDLEDRKLTSKRFINAVDDTAFARCVHKPMQLARHDYVFDTVPGVYIHASAVDNLLRRDVLVPVAPWAGFAAGLTLCAEAALVAMILPPAAAALGVALAGVVYTGLSVFFFRHGVVLPFIPALIGSLLVLGTMVAYRFIVADRDKRFLRRSFSLYLSPGMVEEMLQAEKPPALGGEQRTVSVLFSDVAGFTSLSEALSPVELVALMNEYLSAMTEIVQQHKGFVDKYIGDAIIAVFGAPLEDPDHAFHAVQCALDCRRRLEEMNRSSETFSGHKLRARIGINTGLALAGNIGSKDRMNYTVMGDAVNLASRLEGANKIYRSSILVSEDTVAACGDRVEWREIDTVRVKGRSQGVTIYEPFSPDVTPPRSAAREFAEALSAYRAGSFEEATVRFARLAEKDQTSSVFAERARLLAATPPEEWEGVTALESK